MTATHKTHVCACQHKVPYEIDMSILPGGHIDMLKHCPKCKRLMPLEQLLTKEQQKGTT
jgi:hypothetical protein